MVIAPVSSLVIATLVVHYWPLPKVYHHQEQQQEVEVEGKEGVRIHHR